MDSHITSILLRKYEARGKVGDMSMPHSQYVAKLGFESGESGTREHIYNHYMMMAKQPSYMCCHGQPSGLISIMTNMSPKYLLISLIIAVINVWITVDSVSQFFALFWQSPHVYFPSDPLHWTIFFISSHPQHFTEVSSAGKLPFHLIT